MSIHIKFAILTSSDSGHAGARADIGGDAVVDLMTENGYALVERRLQPDEEQKLSETLREWCSNGEIQLILTTGGTGLGSRDVVPEATRSVIDYEVPGMAEAMRSASLQVTAMAMLSRSVVGVANRTLIVNLPGNPKGAIQTLEVVLPVLPHAIEILNDTHQGEHPIHKTHDDH